MTVRIGSKLRAYDELKAQVAAQQARLGQLELLLRNMVNAALEGKVMRSSNGDAPWLRDARSALGGDDGRGNDLCM